MGRGVSYPTNATVIEYVDISDIVEQEYFDDFIDNIIYDLMDKMPSLYRSDKWIGNENHIILENDFAQIGISTYCDMMTLWVVPKGYYPNLEDKWICRITPNIEYYATHYRIGTMSNGVSVFKKVTK